jgi:hypothetical protein
MSTSMNGDVPEVPGEQSAAEPAVTLADFLENVPPGRKVRPDIGSIKISLSSGGPVPTRHLTLTVAQIRLHCGTPACDRFQFFAHPKTDQAPVVPTPRARHRDDAEAEREQPPGGV